MISLITIPKNNKYLKASMQKHYTKPKGFVGRSICYAIYFNETLYGHILGGSSTLYLKGRNEFFNIDKSKLNNIINNIFYHVEKVNNKYPIRNFTTEVLKAWREQIKIDWQQKYGDKVIGYESLIEPPRTAELYKKDKWVLVGTTFGYTCKRIPGHEKGAFKTGKRVWNTKDLKPKLIFCRGL